jgi:hypothetical protein
MLGDFGGAVGDDPHGGLDVHGHAACALVIPVSVLALLAEAIDAFSERIAALEARVQTAQDGATMGEEPAGAGNRAGLKRLPSARCEKVEVGSLRRSARNQRNLERVAIRANRSRL